MCRKNKGNKLTVKTKLGSFIVECHYVLRMLPRSTVQVKLLCEWKLLLVGNFKACPFFSRISLLLTVTGGFPSQREHGT